MAIEGIDKRIALLSQSIEYEKENRRGLQRSFDDFVIKVERDYTRKTDFEPVKRLVFWTGGVLILAIVSVMTTIVTRILQVQP